MTSPDNSSRKMRKNAMTHNIIAKKGEKQKETQNRSRRNEQKKRSKNSDAGEREDRRAFLLSCQCPGGSDSVRHPNWSHCLSVLRERESE